MTNPVKCTALVLYTPPNNPSIKPSALSERICQAVIESSFRAQQADHKYLQPTTVRERILAGTHAPLEQGPGLPPPCKKTCQELLSLIAGTVDATIDRLDYNGNLPFLKILDQLETGKSFEEAKIDSCNEELGTTCVGSAHAIIKDLQDKHKIEGVLAIQRKNAASPLEHGAVIIECRDGYVLLDARSNPKLRMFAIPFGTTEHYSDFSITAAFAGSFTPLVLKCPGQDFEYCTNVGNGDDLVMKHFIMEAPFREGHAYYPIATYNKDGSDRKFIGVDLKEASIFLKDRKAGTKAENISFKSIREKPEALRQKLRSFMEPHECFGGFHLPADVVFRQLVRLASQEARLQKLFIESQNL